MDELDKLTIDDEVPPEMLELASPRGAGLRQRLMLSLYDRTLQRIITNLVVILLIGTYVQAQTGDFFTVRNGDALAIQIAVVSVVACAMTLVMVAGYIDVSVPGIVVLSGVVAGLLMVNGLPEWLAFILGIGSGVVVGLINSFLVTVVKIPSLIATIGTLYVCVGVANLLTNGLAISGLPLNFSTIGSGFVLGVPIAIPNMLGVVVILVVIQRFTRLGRHAIATGSNPQAAFLNGVNVQRTTTKVFMLSGAAAGWGGIMYASRIGNPSPVLDNDLLFQVIVAIVIGGTSLFGGQGSVIGTFTGALLIGVINNSLDLLGVSTFWQFISLGVLLVLSVGLDLVVRGDRVRRFRKSIASRLPRGVGKTGKEPPSSGHFP